jgi:hypothetical protein
MNSSKFFAAVLIAGTSVFAGSAAHATYSEPPAKTDCGCATSASIIQVGKDNFASSTATGKGSAATFANASNTGYNFNVQTGGVATSKDSNNVATGNTGGNTYSNVVD